MTTKYYIFHQNNSGGFYDYDEKNGISSALVIEATNKELAHSLYRAIVEKYGSSGDSFLCCRWSNKTYENHDLIEDVKNSADKMILDLLKHDNEGNARFRYFIHHLDGRIEGYGLTQK